MTSHQRVGYSRFHCTKDRRQNSVVLVPFWPCNSSPCISLSQCTARQLPMSTNISPSQPTQHEEYHNLYPLDCNHLHQQCTVHAEVRRCQQPDTAASHPAAGRAHPAAGSSATGTSNQSQVDGNHAVPQYCTTGHSQSFHTKTR